MLSTRGMLILPPHIAQRIRDVVARGGGFAIDEEARQHGAIALMGTLGSIWMLRPDGTLWDAYADTDKPLQSLEDRFHLMALAMGTERYPWLCELLPQRPADAIDCPYCKGAGEIVPANAVHGSGGFLCTACDALGWQHGERPKP
jgi:hypothetical protein